MGDVSGMRWSAMQRPGRTNFDRFADLNLSLLAGNRRASLSILVLLGALFFIPGLGSVHLFDWDEANFAEVSREMIESGNYSQVTVNYQPFYEKPPLYFWLQMLSMRVFGVNEFSARLVNALAGIATLVAVYLIGSRIASSPLRISLGARLLRLVHAAPLLQIRCHRPGF